MIWSLSILIVYLLWRGHGLRERIDFLEDAIKKNDEFEDQRFARAEARMRELERGHEA